MARVFALSINLSVHLAVMQLYYDIGASGLDYDPVGSSSHPNDAPDLKNQQKMENTNNSYITEKLNYNLKFIKIK